MFSRFAAACCALAVLIGAAAYAQDRQGAPPGPDATPPPMEGPPPPPLQAPPPSPPMQPLPPQASPPSTNMPMATTNRCGAVAYTADGAFGGAYGMENCGDAERLAVDECMRESSDKSDCARGVVTRRDQWFFIQFCRTGGDWTTNVTTRPTLADVNRDAVEWARTSKYGIRNCRMVPNGIFHAGGLHMKF